MKVGEPVKYSELSRQELLEYLHNFVEGLEQHKLTQDEQEFVNLHKKIILELSHDRIYKVSTARASNLSQSGIVEYDIQYFSSLNAAKKELQKRKTEKAKHPYVAGPDEVQSYGVQTQISLAPDLINSIVTNSDVKLDAPGRFKFYEVRMLQNGHIVPIQFVLTDIHITPSVLDDHQKLHKPTKSGKIIQFKSLK